VDICACLWLFGVLICGCLWYPFVVIWGAHLYLVGIVWGCLGLWGTRFGYGFDVCMGSLVVDWGRLELFVVPYLCLVVWGTLFVFGCLGYPVCVWLFGVPFHSYLWLFVIISRTRNTEKKLLA
jgi:hypothetical protein